MRSEKYFKEKYSRVWKKRVNKYGRDEYVKRLSDLLLSKRSQDAFELAIGTGWPFAFELAKNGVNVEGCDIADSLIEEAVKQSSGIKAWVGSYEDLSVEKKYKLVYCLRSTWYFPDIIKAISSMIDITENGGYLIFDIMNACSSKIKHMLIMHYVKLPITITRNIVRFLLNIAAGRKYLYDSLIMPEIPTDTAIVDRFLKKENVQFEKLSYNQILDGKKERFDPDSFRILYICGVKK